MLTSLPYCRDVFDKLGALYGIDYTVPPHAEFATAVGAMIADRSEE